MVQFLKKYHRWLGIIATLFVLTFSISGIILNHRELLSAFDVNRSILPHDYQYNNWNNAAVKGTIKISNDSILIYGNVGIWLTDSSFSKFTDFNAGLPNGIDNKKISKIYSSSNGQLIAGTYFGLYYFNSNKNIWVNAKLPISEKRIVDINEKQDTLLILSRSYLLKTTDLRNFSVITIPEPEGYDNKIGLFKTLWVIHSGEIYGTVGKIIVDLVGLISIFLSITGIILFINKYKFRFNKKRNKSNKLVVKTGRWNLKWHNKIGWTTLVLLIITTTTGMFLRPPLLVAIAYSQVDKIAYTELDSPNPWFDKLRRINYNKNSNTYIIATLDGVYHTDASLKSKLKKFEKQPPLSIMGVNVFNPVNDSVMLIGSFEGLFLWDTKNQSITDYITKEPYVPVEIIGPPIGNYVVTGYSDDFPQGDVYFDFGSGAKLVDGKSGFVTMPSQIKNQPMSLWNLALELHTGRIYSFLIGDYYILVVPLIGLLLLFILISGTVVWYIKFR